MNFELNEDQAALAESLQRALADRSGFEQRRALVASGAAHDAKAWAALAELGLTALPLPEAHGGFGGGARDLLPVMQALGRSLSLEPFLANTVLGGTALRLGADEATQARLLPRMASGELVLAWAHDEPAGRHAPLWVETRAERRNGRWVLDGIKSNVLAAGLAQHLVVSARVSGAPADADGCALFLVDPNGAGVALREFRLVDDTAAGELALREAEAEPLADPLDAAHARRAIEGTVTAGIAAACADMTGAAQSAYELAMDYLRTRKQFGRLIGENQALRHRAAEMLVCLEMARSMAMAAAVAADAPDGDDAPLDLHRAKLSVARNARQVAHGAIQLHGGIGMTEEYAVGHCLRRIHVLDQLFGDADAHTARLASALN
ncbi:Acyl-CoA dehydrogenase fadE12 [Variovorax sp. PBS-H4]|uniref:acyl-CoA dehydrogenase family protein n=1 Tax=Variovorax sp. PBS-H4 TaxID=434008 RepID=UPI0013182666|nr:acyl-CoA dehydrogenase family protein [Variovorax sp. PBS-H4]VTU40726.1 Acyl-CoA dehydrogenase fadE12 [Variovorax sp. PBS-H4]